MMSNTLLESVVKKNRARLIPFMLALYVLAFLDRSNIGFAKETYQLDTGLSNEAYALGAGIFFVVYAFLGVPANLLMRKFGARKWIGFTTLLWGVLSAAMAWADTEAKFLLVRTLLGAAEAGFFPGMIYLTSQWFPQQNRASIMGLFYMGAPLALTLGSPLSGALLEMHGFMGHPGWFWMFVIEGLLAVAAGAFTFFWLDDSPQHARFLSIEEKQALIGELAREVVSATRYPPIGSRGVGAGVARAARWGRIENYMAEANDELCLLIQVESRTALENLDAILEVDGIDGVFIGPADLSASLGHPDDAGHPDVQRVIEQSIRRIRAAGKAAGFLAVDPAMAEKCLTWGANFVAVGVDTMLYTEALDRRLAMFKPTCAQPQEKASY